MELVFYKYHGPGSDGILEGPFFDNGKISVRILNPDGSEAEKSGNGVRIFSFYLKDAGYVKEQEYKLCTPGGIVDVHFNNETGSNMTV